MFLKNKRRLLLLLLLAIGSIVFFDPWQYLSLERLKLHQSELDQFYIANPLTLVGGYIVMFLLIGLFLLPGATLLSFAAGVIFGPTLGTLVVIVGSGMGGALAFLVSRYLLRDWIESKCSEKIRGVNENLCEKPFNSVLFFRLVPLFPFFAVNIGLALSQMPLKSFFFGTMLGKLPSTYVYSLAGNNLATISSLEDIMSIKVLVSLCLLGVLALIPVAYKKMNLKESFR